MISSITTRKKPGCCILDKLEMGEREEGVAVVQSRKMSAWVCFSRSECDSIALI